MKLSHNRAILLMVLVTLMWSTAGVVTRHLQVTQSFEVTFWRSFFTVISLLVILPLLKGPKVLAGIFKADRLFWFASLCWCGMFTFFMMALTLTRVANVLVTMALGPLVTALFARIFIGHKVPLRTWIAIVAAGLGIGWMFASDVQDLQWLGSLVALGIPISGAAYWTVAQHAQSRGHAVDFMPAVLVGAALSCLITLPMALPFHTNTHDAALLAALGLGQLAIPCILSVACTQVLKAPEVALLALLETPFGIALAWAGAGEAPGASVLWGGSLVIAALVVNELVGWRQRG
jgi:drug/metabolite transporter (DMT)-like permease